MYIYACFYVPIITIVCGLWISDAKLLAKINPQTLDAARVEDMVREYFSAVESVR